MDSPRGARPSDRRKRRAPLGLQWGHTNESHHDRNDAFPVHTHVWRLRRVADRDGRTVSVALGFHPQRHSRGEAWLARHTRHHCREHQQCLCAGIERNGDIWQCDASGNYSQYGSERNLTYFRGIQPTDADGVATFTTIFPGWYQGRATHIHVEVSVNGRSAKVTQIAFPDDISAAVYRTGAYASGGQNPTTNARDMVFADSVSEEMATLVGDTTNGYHATFRVGIAI